MVLHTIGIKVMRRITLGDLMRGIMGGQQGYIHVVGGGCIWVGIYGASRSHPGPG